MAVCFGVLKRRRGATTFSWPVAATRVSSRGWPLAGASGFQLWVVRRGALGFQLSQCEKLSCPVHRLRYLFCSSPERQLSVAVSYSCANEHHLLQNFFRFKGRNVARRLEKCSHLVFPSAPEDRIARRVLWLFGCKLCRITHSQTSRSIAVRVQAFRGTKHVV